MQEETEFVGGVNHVVRHDDTVTRPAGPWTPSVHRLLDHLRAQGFTGAPRALGISEDGNEETVSYIDGEVGHYPLPAHARSDDALRAAARLLRGLHDAAADFPHRPDDVWMLPSREPVEVVCHGDAATYNCVFRNGLPVAFIDFDTAHPGPRLWDASYTAYRFVPLHAPGADEGTLPLPEQARRLRLFADAYGLSAEHRALLPATVAERLTALVDFMTTRAAAGNLAFARHLADGHHRRYLADAEYITAHADQLAD
ncbi:phosphotransferase [Streptacidiphilus sp. PB12-B1b]|uniref:phosphotransferase n=1 Tax=Streptacidiphilus sp. PB12-B1b TaxID=2705012 RepID=UPI0015FC1857|nr:phosphotransferase [Streptacidiphilus sp. PB12-B1b]QMU79654.1 phosphotransferase [Streptacidiphilus sp. PB12-B1b]